MASIPSNGYAEVMAGTNNYSGSNSFDGSCPRTAIPPVIGNDLCNKTYVDAGGGGLIGTLTDKGALITGDGTQAVIFDQNPYQTALTTTTVYDWNSLALGQSRQFTTTAPTTIPLGATITITYSGTDSIKGTVTAVAGTTVTITITLLTSTPYSSAVLLTTTAPDTSTFAGAVFSGQTFPLSPATTTPPTAEIPAFSMITSGSCNVFQNSGGGGNFFFRLLGTGVQRGDSSTQALGTAIIGTANPTALTWSGTNGGCFYNSATAQIPLPLLAIIEPSPPKAADFQYPLGGGFVIPNYAGFFSGYALSYGTGAITIDGDIALIADPASATGLAWGIVGAGGVGAVNSVSGGTNIIMSGSVSAPIVNLRNPLTAELNCGTQSLRDSVSSVGTSGQVLTCGTGGQVLWGANGVSSVTATNLANITIGGTATAPTVGVSNPCNATLALGVQDLTAVNGFDSSTINANGIDTSYFEAGVAATNADLIGNAGGANLLLSGSNLAAVAGHSLRLETPVGGAAVIEHNTIGGAARDLNISSQGNITLAGDNIDLSTTGRLIVPSLASADFLDYNPALGRMSMATDNAGGAANPILFLQNTNASGSVALEVFKNKPTAGAIGDVLFTESVFGKDSANTKQEYTRITHTIRDPTAGAEDGSMELGCFVNGAMTNFIQLNANDAPIGEINFIRPLDFIGGSDANATIKVGGAGSVNLNLDATTSAGTGSIQLKPKTGTGFVAINTAGASNLRLDGTINNLTAPTKNSIDFSVGTDPINGFTINRDLVKLEYQAAITNDVSIISLTNDPSPQTNSIEASYLTPSTGALQQTVIATTPSNHTIQLLDPTAGRTTKIFTSKIELDEGGSEIILDAGAFLNGVNIRGDGDDGTTLGSFSFTASSGTQEISLTSSDIAAPSVAKKLQLDNNTLGNGIISYENNTGDGAELQITSETDLSIATVGGTGNSVFIDALNEITASSTNQLTLKVANNSQPINFQVANVGGYLNFSGTDLQSASAGGSSGQYLVITLNGVSYKIDLLNL